VTSEKTVRSPENVFVSFESFALARPDRCSRFCDQSHLGILSIAKDVPQLDCGAIAMNLAQVKKGDPARRVYVGPTYQACTFLSCIS
jgi:hypothetical protein